MAIIREEHETNYTVVQNQILNNPDMSLKAKGLLCFMLSKPNGWDFSINGLKAQLKEGRDGIASVLKELEKFKYLKRVQSKDGNKFDKIDYYVYETPYTGFTDTGIPKTEVTNTESPIQVNTITSKELIKVNTEIEIFSTNDSEVYSFDDFWNDYGKKVDLKKCKAHFKNLSKKEKQRIKETVLNYVRINNDPKFRKNPLTYLNGKCWNDELINYKSIEPKRKVNDGSDLFDLANG